MFYEFVDDAAAVDLEKISSSVITAGYITPGEVEKTAQILGIPQILNLCSDAGKSSFRSGIEVCDGCVFGTLKIVSIADNRTVSDYIAYYIRKNLFIVEAVSDESCCIRDKFLSSIKRFSGDTFSFEKLIYFFFEYVIDGDSKYLEKTEFLISQLEEQVFSQVTDRSFNLKLLEIKKDMLMMRNYYEQLIDIGEALEDNENELLDENELNYFRIFTNKARRLKDNVDMLRDSAVHLRDAYESSLELNLNRTMKIFTTVNVIFLPLTVIAGWYGMNFDFMPELKWRWGYVFVTALSVITVAAIIFILKKKKWI
ncbi:MAG: CorA family divalent cation transporter [Eubacterium sp.]